MKGGLQREPGRRLAAVAMTLATLAASGGRAASLPAAARTSPAHHDLQGLRPELLALAESAADRYGAQHRVARPDLLSVIDYSLPSTEPRLWVIDRAARRVLFHELVAHGRGSGENLATRFSNREGSLQSSLGLFLTEETYLGRNGYSMRLRGLEPGINDLARERTLVMHGAPYVSSEFARQHGRLGRSWGCPALRPEVARTVIDRIREGSLLFVYARETSWLEASRYLAAERRAASLPAGPTPAAPASR